jgi:hypothetical protein
MRRLAIFLFVSICISCLAPTPDFAGVTGSGGDPYAPVISASGGQASRAQNTVAGNPRNIFATVFAGSPADAGHSAYSPNSWPLVATNPRKLVGRLDQAINDLSAGLASLIVPLAMFSILVNCLVLVVGCLAGWGEAKRFGLGGVLMACAGLLVYYSYSLIIGLLQAFAGRLL